MPQNFSLTISSHGLSEQYHTQLQRAVQQLSSNGKSFQLLGKNARTAHLLVLDGDSAGGIEALQNSRAGQIKLLLAEHPRVGKNVVAVKKPVDVATLMRLLERLFTKMQAQLAQVAPKRAVPSVHLGVDDAQFEKAGSTLHSTLFRVLLEAKMNQQSYRIRHTSMPDVFVDGKNKSIATIADTATLRKIFTIPFEQLWIEKLLTPHAEHQSDAVTITPLYSLLWAAGIACSKGVLIPEHSMDQQVKLRAWPNFTRNDFRPEHLKIAAVMARQAVTLNDLCTLTQLAQNIVIDFYNAAYAVDLIEFDTKDNAQNAQSKNVTQQVKSLLGKIARRLNIG